jgi:hypothetical protein
MPYIAIVWKLALATAGSSNQVKLYLSYSVLIVFYSSAGLLIFNGIHECYAFGDAKNEQNTNFKIVYFIFF